MRIAKYEPLTFACIMCDEQFNASGKSLAQVAEEIAEHFSKNHPLEHSAQQETA